MQVYEIENIPGLYWIESFAPAMFQMPGNPFPLQNIAGMSNITAMNTIMPLIIFGSLQHLYLPLLNLCAKGFEEVCREYGIIQATYTFNQCIVNKYEKR